MNDSDVGYFWDEQWNTSEDEKGNKRRASASSDDTKKDDSKGSWGSEKV